MKKNKIFAMVILSIAFFISMHSNVYADNFELEWVKTYYNNKYPAAEGYNIISYTYDTDNKVVLVKVREKDMEENTYITYAGLYDETNLTVTDLKWVRSYFSKKYPVSQGYVIHTYSFDNKTNKVTVELSNFENNDLIQDEIKCDVVVNGKAYVKET